MTVWDKLTMDTMRSTITEQREEIEQLRAELQSALDALAVVNATLDEVCDD